MSLRARPAPEPRATTVSAILGTLLLALGVGCVSPRPAGNLTPTLIPQPTPDRTVDAVVRGLVTPSLRGSPTAGGTPGSARTTPAGPGTGAGLIPTPGAAFVPTPPSAVSTTLVQATVGRTATSILLAPATATGVVAARTPTPAVARVAPTEPAFVPAPLATAAAPSAAPRPMATVARSLPTVAPPTVAPLPTFGRAPGASGLARP
jgi:hypothetical protein